MSTQALQKVETSPLITELANEWKITPLSMLNTLKTQVFPKDRDGNPIQVSNEMLIAFLQVCNTYKLNPFVKEIYAFPGKGGNVIPMVPVDGWANIINRHATFDGLEFVDEWQQEKNTKTLFSTTCIIYRKDRSHPIKVTEYMQECYQENKEPWRKWPARMLRHKALIQCARIAFSLAGIVDPDEAERIAEVENGKPEIKRPTVIDVKQTSTSTAVEAKTGVESVSAAETAPVKDSAPAAVEQKAVEAAVEETPEMPGTAFTEPEPAKCFCTCCKNRDCDCLKKEEFDRCGCPNCQKYMSLMRDNPEPTAEPTATGKPAGPYVAQDKLKKLFAAAASAGIKVEKDSHEDELHKLLKQKYQIESLKEIPVSMYDQILKEIAPNLKLANGKK